MSEHPPVQHPDFDPAAEAAKFTNYDQQANFQKEWLGLGEQSPEDVTQAAKDSVEYFNRPDATGNHYDESMGKTDQQKSLKELAAEQAQAELNSDRTRSEDIQGEINARIIKSGAKRDTKYDAASKGQIEREAHLLNAQFDRKEKLKESMNPEKGSPDYRPGPSPEDQAKADEAEQKEADKAEARRKVNEAHEQPAEAEVEESTETTQPKPEEIEDAEVVEESEPAEPVRPLPKRKKPAEPVKLPELPKPAVPGEDAPALDVAEDNKPLDLDTRHGIVRWFRSTPDAKISDMLGNGLKAAFSGKRRAKLQEVADFAKDDTRSYDEVMQKLGEVHPGIQRLAKLAMENQVEVNIPEDATWSDVKRIVKDAAKSNKAAQKAEAAINNVPLTTRETFGDPSVSAEDSRAQMAGIRGVGNDFDQLQQWRDDEGVMAQLSPAAANLLIQRLNQRAKVEAAAAQAGQPQETRGEQRRREREERRNEENTNGRSLLDRFRGRRQVDQATQDQINEIVGMTNDEIVSLQPEDAQARFTPQAYQRYMRERRQVIR